MNNNKPTIDDKYVRPSRAAEIMKTAQSVSQTLHIFGVVGYGKASLVADFFAGRRYQMNSRLLYGDILSATGIIVGSALPMADFPRWSNDRTTIIP